MKIIFTIISWAHRLFCSSCELPNSRNCGKEFQYLRDSLFGIRVSSVLGRPQSVEARTDMSTSALSDITDTQYYYIRTSISQLYFNLILSTVCFVFQVLYTYNIQSFDIKTWNSRIFSLDFKLNLKQQT